MSTLAGNQVVIQLPAKEIQLLLLLPLFSSSKAYKKVLFHQCHFFCKHRFVRTPAHHLHHRGCHTDWFLLSSQQYRLWHFDQSFKVPDARAYVKSSKRKEVQLVFLSLLIIHFQSNKRLCIKKKRITSDYVQLQLNKFVKPLEETRISALILRIMWCDINNSRQTIWLNNDTNCETHWVIKVPDGKSNNFHQKLETCTKRFHFFCIIPPKTVSALQHFVLVIWL